MQVFLQLLGTLTMKARRSCPFRNAGFFALLLLAPPLAVAAEGADGNVAAGWAVAVVLVMIVGVFAVIIILQRKFLQTCREMNDLNLYAQAPFGVPTGTIRATIALLHCVCFACVSFLNRRCGRRLSGSDDGDLRYDA